MSVESWFFIANAVVWLGLSTYLAFLGRAQHVLERRLSFLEEAEDMHERS